MNKTKKTLDVPEKKRLVEEICLFLQRQDDRISAAYLFGSFNTGGPFSDIDLAILFKQHEKNPLDFEIDLETQLEKVVEYPVDVRMLNGAPLSFCQNVIRTGRIILDRDPNMRADFQGRILKQYFDFSAFRKRYLNEVVNAPV
jgi:predicted nucleotidyltransferase